jgi:hypothetical protein
MLYKFLLFLIPAFGLTFAQQTGSLRGVVTDSLKGEALPYANVLIEGTNLGASADLNGNFTITGIPAGKDYDVRFSYVSYYTKVLTVTIKANSMTQIRVPLLPSSIQLQTIEMIGEKMDRPNETNIGLQKLTIRDLELLPKGVETDVFRSLQYLPGVQSTGDVSARYYVRGGGSNQNLVLLNGVSVYNPFHALGLFSIIDPEMINAVEFYKGGYPSDFGGRLSSVLNLVTKDGNKNRLGGNAQVSFLTGKAAIEGPLPGGSFIVTGRRSLFKDVLKKFINYKDAPFEFYDISAKANYSNNSEESLTKISVHGFNSLDQLKSDDPLKSDFKWVNDVYGIKWFQAWENVPIYSEASFSYSGFDGAIDPKQSLSRERANTVRDITMQTDFTNILDTRDEFKAGYILKTIKTDLKLENQQGQKIGMQDNGMHFSVYTKYRFMRFEDLGVDIGTRVNLISLAKNRSSILEPRINMTYNIFPGIQIKGAWGIYTQELITVTNENEIISLFEPWIIVPDYLKAEKSIHYIAGINISLIQPFNLSTEFYYKKLTDIAEINDRKASDLDPDFVLGSGEAFGNEILLEYKTNLIQSSVSYSLSWAYRNINGWVSHPKYDTRHIVTTHFNYNLGKDWQAGFSWFFNSGLPFTQIQGYYDKLYFDDLFYSSGLYGYYLPYTILADRNLGRLPYYHRLDLMLSKTFDLSITKLSVSFNVMNVYNRKNIFYFERDTGERVNMVPILPTATVKLEI